MNLIVRSVGWAISLEACQNDAVRIKVTWMNCICNNSGITSLRAICAVSAVIRDQVVAGWRAMCRFMASVTPFDLMIPLLISSYSLALNMFCPIKDQEQQGQIEAKLEVIKVETELQPSWYMALPITITIHMTITNKRLRNGS